MKKSVLVAVSAFSIALGLTGCASQSSVSETNPNTTIAPSSYMFVVSAPHASIKQKNANTYVISFDRHTVNQVVKFSDRPSRYIHYITGNELQSYWNEKVDDNFRTDPPNAVLTGANMKPKVVVVEREKLHGEQIIYEVSSAKALPLGMLKQPAMTIDGIIPCSGSSTGSC